MQEEKKEFNILGNFDGISCGQIACEEAGLEYDNYFATEVDPACIDVTQRNYPKTIQLGDIKKVHMTNLGIEVDGLNSTMRVIGRKINLLLGGSPCQGLSFAGDGLDFEDPRSKLFFEHVRIKEESNPDYFLFENTKMKKASEDVISKMMGVDPIRICSSIFGAQHRQRLFWTNIPVDGLPSNNTILLKDILCENPDPKSQLSEKAISYMNRLKSGKPRWKSYPNPLEGKAGCLTANMIKGVPYGVIMELNRFLTPEECERLQGVPVGYTAGHSFHKRRSMLGNGWDIRVIKHILKGIKNK